MRPSQRGYIVCGGMSILCEHDSVSVIYSGDIAHNVWLHNLVAFNVVLSIVSLLSLGYILCGGLSILCEHDSVSVIYSDIAHNVWLHNVVAFNILLSVVLFLSLSFITKHFVNICRQCDTAHKN